MFLLCFFSERIRIKISCESTWSVKPYFLVKDGRIKINKIPSVEVVYTGVDPDKLASSEAK